MKFNLRAPCETCPFRKDIHPFLTAASARGYAEGILLRDTTFACHKTQHRRIINRSHCGGALAFAAKHGKPNRMIRIARALGLWDGVLNPNGAPVFDSVDAMAAHHGRSER